MKWAQERDAQDASAAGRVEWADGVRSVAIVLVIFVHVSAPLLSRSVVPDPLAWWTASVFDSIGQLGVPLFIILSGMLLLGPREKEAESLRAFASKRIGRVLLPFAVYSGIYLLWRLHYGADLTWSSALRDFYTGRVRGHLWFVYMIVGLYMICPILRMLYNVSRKAWIWYYLAVSLLLVSLLTAIQTGLGLGAGVMLTGFTVYTGYFAFGGAVWDERAFRRPHTAVLVAMFLGSVSFTVFGTYLGTMAAGLARTESRYYSILMPNMVLGSLSAFLVLRRSFTRRRAREGSIGQLVVREIGACSYGVYLLHPLVLDILRDGLLGFRLTGATWTPLLGIPATAMAALILSAACIGCTRRIPLVKRLLS